jgi:hypothetical protein
VSFLLVVIVMHACVRRCCCLLLLENLTKPALGLLWFLLDRMIIFVVRDGLLAKMTFIVSEGSELSGQPGFYTQIGGVIF